MIEFSTTVYADMANELSVHEGQINQHALTPDNLRALVLAGKAWAVKKDGKLIALMGHTPMWIGRTVMWAYLSKDCGRVMVALTRAIAAEINRMQVDFLRIEAYAEVEHREGNRWLKAMGFRCEGVMRKFVNGIDYNLYAKVG